MMPVQLDYNSWGKSAMNAVLTASADTHTLYLSPLSFIDIAYILHRGFARLDALQMGSQRCNAIPDRGLDVTQCSSDFPWCRNPPLTNTLMLYMSPSLLLYSVYVNWCFWWLRYVGAIGSGGFFDILLARS